MVYFSIPRPPHRLGTQNGTAVWSPLVRGSPVCGAPRRRPGRQCAGGDLSGPPAGFNSSINGMVEISHSSAWLGGGLPAPGDSLPILSEPWPRRAFSCMYVWLSMSKSSSSSRPESNCLVGIPGNFLFVSLLMGCSSWNSRFDWISFDFP